MSFDPAKMLRDFKVGLGFKVNDVLRPRSGARPTTRGVIDDSVVVIRQDYLAPHEYDVVGELATFSEPKDRFVQFTINGHDWEKVGHV